MIADLRRIATRRFSGDTRRGPRYSYIVEELRKRGCSIAIDRHSNIWVERGTGRRSILISSHLDVDPRIRKMKFRRYRIGQRYVVEGVLDNAVGCLMNLILTHHPPRNSRIIHVFTASEEIDRTNPRRFCRSAREVVKELRKRKIRPELCVVIDVTFPAILHPEGKLDWRKEYEALFDVSDRTHCYLDGYVRRKTAKLANLLVRRFRDPRIATRKLCRYDEAFIYSRIAPAFAFGPVVHGHLDRPDQKMPLVHLKTCMRFLNMVLDGYGKPRR